MGAWGPGIFENDSALDYLSDLADSPRLQSVRSALRRSAGAGSRYLEVDDASAALVAAEVVAAVHGQPCPEMPDELQEILPALARRPAAEDIELALTAVERVGKQSELQELWSESDALAAWEACLADLQRRLRTAGGGRSEPKKRTTE